MSFLSGLETLLGMHQAQNQGQQGHPLGAQLAQKMQTKPDFTYNPNPATNIPNSTHNLQLAQQQHGQVPQQPGLAPHPLLQLLQTPYNQAQTVGQGNRFVNAQQFPQLAQGGNYNPGFTPLQGSNVPYNQGPQPTAEFRGQPIPQQNNLSPQQSIGLY